jgi:bifunctional non-homologous end joining protein LigD
MHVMRVGQLAELVPATYMIFDVLYLDRYSLMELAYQERRRILEDLRLTGRSWQTPPAYPGEGHTLLSAATHCGLEGIVAKRLTSRYEPGRRGRDWFKIKVTRRQEFVIGGWMPGEGGHEGLIGSLLVGYYSPPPARARPGVLHFAGGVGTGFDADDHRELLRLLRKRRRAASPFAEKVPRSGAIWVEPDLVAEVEFFEWTPAGIIRHPVYRGLRPDKPAREIVREEPVAAT